MARKKLFRVPALEKGNTRLAAIKSIASDLDLGNGLTVENYQVEVQKTKEAVDRYNTILSTIDDLYNNAQERVKMLSDWNERMLSGVASKYGKNSSEYEMAGGVRKSERKKPTKKATV